MVVSLIMLLLVWLVFLIVCQFYAVLFVVLGVPKNKAKFQAISILTNTGFTTGHSEVIMQTRRRRNVAISGMIFGFIFSVCFVSLLINVVMTFNDPKVMQEFWHIILIAIGVFAVLYIIFKLKFVKDFFFNIFEKLGRKIIYGNKRGNYMIVYEYIKKAVIAEISIYNLPEYLYNKNISQAKLPTLFGIQVLAIHKKENNKIIDKVSKNDCIENGDVVTVYGEESVIKNLFDVAKID